MLLECNLNDKIEKNYAFSIIKVVLLSVSKEGTENDRHYIVCVILSK
jgi:hypothetical protein